MNQFPSHSQTPEFDTNKSQTTSVLHQHPTTAEMRPSLWSKTKPVLKEFAAIGLIIASAASTVVTIRSCSNDVDRQHAQALKHQLQFSALSEGAR